MKKFYLVAGEASGDVHASNLILSLKELYPDAIFRGLGGNRMEKAGMELDAHYKEVAFMGFVEVILHLRKILRHLRFAEKAIRIFKPDVLILVDYPGFNLRLMKKVRPHVPKIVYYISPQVWAWKENRTLKIKEFADEVITILPFEKAFYKRYGMDVKYAGHPLIDELAQWEYNDAHKIKKEKQIALLPGSRMQEIRKMLPVFLKLAALMTDHTFIVAAVEHIDKKIYANMIGSAKNIRVETGKTREILLESEFAIVTSGTATLETALLKTPQVVCYKGNQISYLIAKRLVKINYISLVNLIMDAPVVTELIQEKCTPELIYKTYVSLMETAKKLKMQEDYHTLEMKLGGEGASRNAALCILALID